jgi:hypothetical protein
MLKYKKSIMKDYQKSFTVNKPVNQVYTAITEHIDAWWSHDLTGTAAIKGDAFNIAFNSTRKTFVIEDATSDKQVVWKCTKAYIDMASLENKAEWVGTTLIWTLIVAGDETTLTFLHKGLNQSFQCYNVCEAGWDYFLASLQAYLETGTGTPHLKTTEAVS